MANDPIVRTGFSHWLKCQQSKPALSDPVGVLALMYLYRLSWFAVASFVNKMYSFHFVSPHGDFEVIRTHTNHFLQRPITWRCHMAVFGALFFERTLDCLVD